jgi:hypothetical protein
MLSDNRRIVHNCSNAKSVTSGLSVWSHSKRVSGSISDIFLNDDFIWFIQEFRWLKINIFDNFFILIYFKLF